MREQILFSQSPAFKAFVEGLFRHGNRLCIHGIFIDLHPTWRHLVDARRTSGLPVNGGPRTWPWPPRASDRLSPAPYDFNTENMPDAWRTFARQANKGPAPFIVSLWILPLTTDRLRDFRRLDQYVQQQPFFVRFQQRQMAQLAISVDGSSEMTANLSGALGGFLKDQNGKHWGLTCGHVASVVGDYFTLEDVSGTRYQNAGTVIHSDYSSLPAVDPQGLCNPYVSGTVPDTDGALLELDERFTPTNLVRGLGTVDEIFDRTRLNSGSPVCMNGVKSGMEDYEIGGYGVTLKVKCTLGRTTNYHCFSHLFEFHDPTIPPSWMPSKAAQAFMARPLRGDSGSWICFRKRAETCAYFGNLIAVENLSGIATFAESLLNWANVNYGVKLTVF